MSEKSDSEEAIPGTSIQISPEEIASNKNLENKESNKTPIDWDNPITQALLANDHNKEPTLGLLKEKDSTARCNTCKLPKSRNQPWEDHNISQRRIEALIKDRGFNTALNELTK